MSKKSVVITVVLLLLAAAFRAGMFYRERSPSQAYELTDVLVARVDLPARTVLKEELVETMRLPRHYMQQDAYEMRSMSDIRLINNLVTLVRIPKGNQITQSSLDAGGPKAAADSGVPPSQRHYLEGVKYFQNANYEQARKEWKTAMKMDPSNTEAAAGLKRIEQILAGSK
ncbi:MAG: SAF domain-containing protein [Elusimicrobiales bacterium]|nr:SAF domain-containing protein [Elusimicrobiales bacterium]